MVEFEPTKELMVLKEISKTRVYITLKPSQILRDEKVYLKLHGLNFVRSIDEFELGPIEVVISVYLASEGKKIGARG
jgi:hypothetical protein